MRVVLNHYSNVAGAKGKPGDVVNPSKKQAEVWLQSGAAVLPDKESDEPKSTQDDSEPAETGDGEPEPDAGDETETTGSGSSESEPASEVKPAKPAKKKAAQK